MSKGLGRVQRRLLDVLSDERAYSSTTLACEVYEVPRDPNDGRRWITETQSVSVLRALRRLAKSGKIRCLGRSWRNGTEGTASRVTSYPTYWDIHAGKTREEQTPVLESLIERFLNQVSQVFMPRVFECRTTS
jgi:hypothetical protein